MASVIQSLDKASDGSIFIFQGCCHNPTGRDFTQAQWAEIATVMRSKNHFTFFDATYQGLGARLGKFMTLFSETRDASPENIELSQKLFDSIGRTLDVIDNTFNAATTLTGTAYALTTIALEGMMEGALQQGLPRASSLEIAAQRFKGLAQMLEQGQSPSEIRDEISSPAGVTLTGVVGLNKSAVRSAFAVSIIKATHHAKVMVQNQD